MPALRLVSSSPPVPPQATCISCITHSNQTQAMEFLLAATADPAPSSAATSDPSAYRASGLARIAALVPGAQGRILATSLRGGMAPSPEQPPRQGKAIATTTASPREAPAVTATAAAAAVPRAGDTTATAEPLAQWLQSSTTTPSSTVASVVPNPAAQSMTQRRLHQQKQQHHHHQHRHRSNHKPRHTHKHKHLSPAGQQRDHMRALAQPARHGKHAMANTAPTAAAAAAPSLGAVTRRLAELDRRAQAYVSASEAGSGDGAAPPPPPAAAASQRHSNRGHRHRPTNHHRHSNGSKSKRSSSGRTPP